MFFWLPLHSNPSDLKESIDDKIPYSVSLSAIDFSEAAMSPKAFLRPLIGSGICIPTAAATVNGASSPRCLFHGAETSIMQGYGIRYLYTPFCPSIGS